MAALPPLPGNANPDQLLPNEMPQSSEAAFGFVLPQGMKVTKRLYNNVVMVSTDPSSVVSDYVRSQVDATISVEPGKTSFLNAKAKNSSCDFDGNLRIDVSRRGATTVLELWAEAVPPEPTSRDQ